MFTWFNREKFKPNLKELIKEFSLDFSSITQTNKLMYYTENRCEYEAWASENSDVSWVANDFEPEEWEMYLEMFRFINTEQFIQTFDWKEDEDDIFEGINTILKLHNIKLLNTEEIKLLKTFYGNDYSITCFLNSFDTMNDILELRGLEAVWIRTNSDSMEMMTTQTGKLEKWKHRKFRNYYLFEL